MNISQHNHVCFVLGNRPLTVKEALLYNCHELKHLYVMDEHETYTLMCYYLQSNPDTMLRHDGHTLNQKHMLTALKTRNPMYMPVVRQVRMELTKLQTQVDALRLQMSQPVAVPESFTQTPESLEHINKLRARLQSQADKSQKTTEKATTIQKTVPAEPTLETSPSQDIATPTNPEAHTSTATQPTENHTQQYEEPAPQVCETPSSSSSSSAP